MKGGYEHVGDAADDVGGRKLSRWNLSRCPVPVRVISILLIVAIVACGLIIPIVLLFSGNATLENSVSADRLRVHLTRIETIAKENGGSRAPWTGYNASVDYVEKELAANTNHNISRHYFEMPSFQQTSPSILSSLTPVAYDYVAGYSGDFMLAVNSASGSLSSAQVVYVGDACDTTFPILETNQIALVVRGSCNLVDKVSNAALRNASAIIIYNDDPADGMMYYLASADKVSSIPAFGCTNMVGVALRLGKPVVNLDTGAIVSKTITTQNLCAETIKGNAESVIVIGAHLDSVAAGAGINDNGSGSAMILEMAINLNQLYPNPVNKVRFCWWAAEEEGLLGSIDYVSKLSVKDKAAIKLYLNFDMIASRNFISFTFDGSTAPGGIVRNHSSAITNLFVEQFEKSKSAYKLEPYGETLDAANTDYGPFLFAGIPSGGLHSGAGEMKTMEERSQFGGLANAPADSCYHEPCDGIENVDYSSMVQSGQFAGAVLEVLVNEKDIDQFLMNVPPPPSMAQDFAMETERSVCHASHVERELVCMPQRKESGKKRSPRMKM